MESPSSLFRNLAARFSVGSLVLLIVPFAWAEAEPVQPNVLFIVVDDLRPDLGCYGYDAASTPNIDRLAKSGVLFRRAYCQMASCGPSRASFLSGLRPDTVKVYDNGTTFRKAVPDAVTLPQYFKTHGYHTQSLGKVFHGIYRNEIREDPASWSVPAWRPVATQYLTQPSIDILRRRFPKEFDGSRPASELMAMRRFKGPAWESPPVEDSELTDGRTVHKAISVLGELKSAKEPFFLAVGFVKPHAPFVAPKRYFDRLDRSAIKLPAQRTLPDGTPALASTSKELYEYDGGPKADVLSDDLTKELTVAYDACVSFIDQQVGRVLGELERLDLRNNTIVVFTSDHGYHLGEAGQWCKNTNFEESLRVPLIVSDPRKKESAGSSTDGIVELIDLYPTLASLCGLPSPRNLEGDSFDRLIDSPQQPGKFAAFGQHKANASKHPSATGYSVRTEEFRFTQWQTPNSEIVAEELYQPIDGRTGSKNLIDDPRYSADVIQLREILKAGWRGAKTIGS